MGAGSWVSAKSSGSIRVTRFVAARSLSSKTSWLIPFTQYIAGDEPFVSANRPAIQDRILGRVASGQESTLVVLKVALPADDGQHRTRIAKTADMVVIGLLPLTRALPAAHS